MSLISQSINSLKGGISQQPEILKSPEQGIEQINGWSSELGGISKRPPMVFKKELGAKGSLGNNPLIHLVDRDETEKYFVCLTTNGIKVFDTEGNPQQVKGDFSYVTTDNPARDLKVLTIADYTFIVNTKKKVTQSRLKHLPDYNPRKEALIIVKGGQYGKTISVYLNGKRVVEHILPTGSESSHVKALDAQAMLKAMVGSFSDEPNYKVTVGNGYLLVKTVGSHEIKDIKVEDGYANQLCYGLIHDIQSFNKLPLEAPDGYIVKVSGDLTKGTDAYYVKYSTKDKVWEECAGWNIPDGIQSDTMPYALVREEDGSFNFKQLEWGKRKSGDLKTSEDPSFVGDYINDVFLYRNRLGFLSGENVILSKTGKYFEFYPSSVASLSDDDPIDIAVNSSRINILKYAIPFDNELILFSDKSQFTLTSSTTLTANNIQLNLASSYNTTNRVRPYYLGKNIYFVNNRSGFSSIYKYYTAYSNTSSKIADDITSYVPNYVPEDIVSMKGSTTENFLAILTGNKRNVLYVYKFYYDEETLKQQSWSNWDLGESTSILSTDIISSKMYLIVETENKVLLTSIDFTKNSKDFTEEIYKYHLDYKKTYRPTVYDEVTDTTTFKLNDIYGTSTLPFNKGVVYIVSNKGVAFRFEPEDSTWKPEDELKIKGDLRAFTYVIGVSYNFKYTFSKFLIKQQDGSGGIVTTDTGRLQLRRAWLNYQDSGYCKINVIANNRTYTKELTGSEIGYSKSRLNSLNIVTGQIRFPCQGQAQNVEVSLESDTPTPLHIIGAGWEAIYTRRTNQI